MCQARRMHGDQPGGSRDAEFKTTRAIAAAAARRHLLDVGRAMAFEQPVNSGIDHIRVTEVAKRANMTTGAIYHHWDNQESYRSELMDELLAPYELQDSAILELVASLTAAGELTVQNLVDLAAWDALRQLSTNPRFSLQMGFWSRRNDPAIRERLVETNRLLSERREAMIAAFLPLTRRRLVEGVTPRDLVTMLDSLTVGFAIRRAIDPDSVPLIFPDVQGDSEGINMLRQLAEDRQSGDSESESPNRINVASLAYAAILAQMTESVDI